MYGVPARKIRMKRGEKPLETENVAKKDEKVTIVGTAIL